MQYEDQNRLERLQKKLYSRKAPDIMDEGRSDLNKEEDFGKGEPVKEGWEEMEDSAFDQLAQKFSNMSRTKHHFVKKIFTFSVIFFVLAAGVATFVFFGGLNQISSRNVDIKVVGPLAVGGGQEVSLDINVINNNKTDLESPSLLVTYPEGTRSAIDLSKELNEERYALETIKAGQSSNQSVRAVFFGDKEEVKELKISLEYKVENSSALFYKDKIHQISISSAPVILTATYPKEVNSGQELGLNLEVASNSKDKLSNFLVTVEYPFGFVFKEASPAPTFGNNVWQFSSLEPSAKKNITVTGAILGQNNEERVFKISAGSASTDDERLIAVPFTELAESVLVKKSFIGLDVNIGYQKGDYAARGGERVPIDFTVSNNLPSKMYDVSVEAALSGGALDQREVSPSGGGFFQSFNNTILWDKRAVSGFVDMDPGARRDLSFSLTPLLYESIARGVKPEIEITITARGERILESGSVEKISASETRKITLNSDLSLSSKLARSLGNIENSGPIPPRPDVPTTYTVVWSLTNSFNQVSNVEVRATLPSYVKYTGLKSPESESVSFNQITNEVVWNAGSVLPNTGLSAQAGFGSPKKEVYFQIEFLPSVSQLGQAPQLLGEASVSAIDKVTGKKFEYKVPALNSNFSGDPSYRSGYDKVTQ